MLRNTEYTQKESFWFDVSGVSESNFVNRDRTNRRFQTGTVEGK